VAHGDAVLRGRPAAAAFSVFCYEDDRLTAVESVNKPGDHVLARKLIARGLGVTRDEAADARFDLKARANALLAAAA
jgi:3-phenylpropionate/trans-cinnamate dioxygenase ferredoxin reductase subunit